MSGSKPERLPILVNHNGTLLVQPRETPSVGLGSGASGDRAEPYPRLSLVTCPEYLRQYLRPALRQPNPPEHKPAFSAPVESAKRKKLDEIVARLSNDMEAGGQIQIVSAASKRSHSSASAADTSSPRAKSGTRPAPNLK